MTFIEDVADAITSVERAQKVSIVRSMMKSPESVIVVTTDGGYVYSVQVEQIAGP